MKQPSVHALLKKYGIRPRKKLGQHFLAAGPTIDKIVATLDLHPDDEVLEIGPGLGVMTRRIAEMARHVIAVERDERMVEILNAEMGDLNNISIVHEDILETDVDEIAPGPGSLKVAGNLPYNISSPILFWILKNRRRIERAVVMVQREVADRMAARPGGKNYGALTVMLQAQASVKKVFDVSAASFVPPPEITSSAVSIDFTGVDPAAPDLVEDLRRVVRAAFGKRRKTLRNALLGSEDLNATPAVVDKALADAGLDGGSRPERIPVEGYIRLARCLGM